jgi:hypothetical protein
MLTTFSPEAKRLATAAVIAPEPEAASVITGSLVPKSSCNRSCTVRMSFLNSELQWWIISRAMASRTLSSNCVGPGVRRRTLFNIIFPQRDVFFCSRFTARQARRHQLF